MRRRGSRADAKRSKQIRGLSAVTLQAAEEPPPDARAAAGSRAWALAPRLIPLLLVGAGLGAYINSFDGTFVFDDRIRIINNPQIRHLWPPWEVMGRNSRPLVQLSLAVNYALGGLSVWGYHAFNLAVHLLAALTLFALVRRTLESHRLRARYGQAAPWLALAVALLWLVHPLQTESVTYIIQRAESLMGLFYLLTLYCALRGALSPHPRRWFIAAVSACALGMGSKEVMVSAPLVVLLYDRVFLADSFTDVFRRRSGLYWGLAATWVVAGALLASGGRGFSYVNEGALGPGPTSAHYAITQFGVIVHYLRLALWPHPLIFDYAWPLAETVSAVLPWAAIVLALVGVTALVFRRLPALGFLGAWFFLILVPTSSLVPIADVACEHRMYLPLAAVVALVVIGAYEALGALFRRLGAPHDLRRWVLVGLLVAAVAGLGSATFRRNEDYRSEFAIWNDTLAKRPENPRAHNNLGVIQYRRGKVNEAIANYSEALRLEPEYAGAHNSLGAALASQGHFSEAIPHLFEASRINPRYATPHYNLGGILFRQGRITEAIAQYSEALRRRPAFPEARHVLGLALAKQTDTNEVHGPQSAPRLPST